MNQPLEIVRLETSIGSLIAEKAVPLFEMMPEVITWGRRVFRHHGDGAVYREINFTFRIEEE